MPILDIGEFAPLRGYRGKRELDLSAIPRASSGGSGGFAAAKINRLTMDFLASSRSADQDLFGDNLRLRARARKLALDNPHARKFLAMLTQNVVGPHGITMQARLTNDFGKKTAQTGEANRRIEAAWKQWSEIGNCTADGGYSFAELQQMAIKNIGREGENLLRVVYGRGPEYGPHGVVMQPLDNDQLDDTMRLQTADGGEVRMGVEVNQYRRPVAYWLWDGHPYDVIGGGKKRVRIPAEAIIHSFVKERPGQTRGYTHMAASILSMNNYARYDEAVIVAARASAAKFMVIQQQAADGYDGSEQDAQGNDANADGTQYMSANAGEALVLDAGQTATYIDPRFPTNTFRDFTKTTVRNIAAGLLVSYPSLGNDLEGVNFSSIRAGLLDERDSWRILQHWFIDHFLKPVFSAWLKMALLTELSDLNLTPAQTRQIVWRARGWDWVDPVKDADASVLETGNGFDTMTNILAEKGMDFEETMLQRKAEQDFIAKVGLVLGTDIYGDQAGKGVAATSDNGKEAEAVAEDAGKGGK